MATKATTKNNKNETIISSRGSQFTYNICTPALCTTMCLCVCYLSRRLIHRVPHSYGIVKSHVSNICITSYSAFKPNLKTVSSDFSCSPCTVQRLQCSYLGPDRNTKLKARCIVNSRLATVTSDTKT